MYIMMYDADGDGDLLYHNFNTSVSPAAFPGGSTGCATATATERHWQVSDCQAQHHVVCQSGHLHSMLRYGGLNTVYNSLHVGLCSL